MQHGLTGVPLFTHESDSNSNIGTPIKGLDVFMEYMDAKDKSMALTP